MLGYPGAARVDALFGLYVTLFLPDFMSRDGTAFNGNAKPSGAEELKKSMHLFEQAAAE